MWFGVLFFIKYFTKISLEKNAKTEVIERAIEVTKKAVQKLNRMADKKIVPVVGKPKRDKIINIIKNTRIEKLLFSCINFVINSIMELL